MEVDVDVNVDVNVDMNVNVDVNVDVNENVNVNVKVDVEVLKSLCHVCDVDVKFKLVKAVIVNVVLVASCS